jgi:CRP-like cAMP-binding protein
MSEIVAERIRVAVRSLPMFRGLSREDHERISALATVREFDRGDSLWHAGDPTDHLTLILKGRVKIVRHAPAGDVILEIFGQGEPVGAVAVYQNIPYPATAIALEPTSLLCLPKREYFDLLDRHPGFARAIVAELTRLNLALARRLEEMRGQRVDARIASLLLSLGERVGRPSAEGFEIPLRLSRQEIAAMVGTTVETTIRIMSQWGRSGLVITGEGRFVIPALDRLRAVADPSAPAAALDGPVCEPTDAASARRPKPRER